MRKISFALFLLGTMFLYGENFDPNCPNKTLPKSTFLQKPASATNPTVSGYNSPARVDVRRSWGLYVEGSFIYWQPKEEGLELGTDLDLTDFNNGIDNGSIVNLSFPYKPGFKAGLGLHTSEDNWDLYAEYTWLYTTHHKTAGGSQTPIQSKWYVTNALFSSFAAKWRMHLDIGDLNLSRACYVGKSLVERPYLGGRGLWIRQLYSQEGVTTFLGNAAAMHAKSRSWALGPRIGVEMDWLFTTDLRLFGTASASLLYTKYTVLYKCDSTVFGTPVAHIKNKISFARPNADIGIGLGWGTYFSNYNWHIDISASYDFQVFFNQNMMANLAFNSSDGDTGNLYLQGLTATLRLDF